MVELFKIAMANPANAVIIALCVAVTTLGTGQMSMQVAMAVMVEKQSVNEEYQVEFKDMSKTIIRIDQNLIDVKASIKNRE